MLIVEDNRVALATSEFPPTTWELIMPLHNNATQSDHDECAVFIFFFSFFFVDQIRRESNQPANIWHRARTKSSSGTKKQKNNLLLQEKQKKYEQNANERRKSRPKFAYSLSFVVFMYHHKCIYETSHMLELVCAYEKIENISPYKLLNLMPSTN